MNYRCGDIMNANYFKNVDMMKGIDNSTEEKMLGEVVYYKHRNEKAFYNIL